MSQSSPSLPMAGDYLVVTFADLMHSTRFRRHVWAHMQLAERRRLESLRLQALYGDAPDHTQPLACPSSPSSPSAAHLGTHKSEEEEEDRPPKTRNTASDDDEKKSESTPASSSASAAATATRPPGAPSPPRWFDIAGRARYKAWVALRGCMTPDVAAECFCAEFLGLVKKYPHPALLPPVEAALSTAQGLAQRTRSLRPGVGEGVGRQRSVSGDSSSDGPRLQVRALQGDPAALALLWVCRAYRIPCEFVVEPLSKAMGDGRRARNTPSAAAAGNGNHHQGGTAAVPPNPYLPYTMADACYPFSATLLCSASAAAAASVSPPTTVTTPEAAFVLLADTFLAAYPHWMGVPSDPPSTATTVLRRCAWVEELQNITRHLRTPILALLVHHATQRLPSSTAPPSSPLPPSSSPSAVFSTGAGERAVLLRAVAAHLHRYESWTMSRVVHRRVGQAQSVLSPLLASTAVVDALQHAYAPERRAVSAADVFLASCGYTLCTHPFCADVFPHLRVPASAADGGVVRSQWETAAPPSAAAAAAAAAGSAPAYVPWSLPLYLSGLPAVYNEKINQLLQRETRGATRHEQQQQPARLFISDAPCSAMDSQAAHSASRPQQRSIGFYEVSAASVTKEAAEAVQQLILTRLTSLRQDDLQHSGSNSDGGAAVVVGSTSSLSGTPFLVLGHVLALAWTLAQEQVPAFPYFMLDGNPDHFGGFSFLPEDGDHAGNSTRSRHAASKAGGAAGRAGSMQARPRFQVTLAPAPVVVATPHPSALSPSSLSAAAAIKKRADAVSLMGPTAVPDPSMAASASSQDGGLSIESQLRGAVQAVRASVLHGLRRLSGEESERQAAARRNSGVNATHVLRSGGGDVEGKKTQLQAPAAAADGSAARL